MMDKYISMIFGEMSMGENISVFECVDQIAVLSAADVFLSHCGLNSVSESLYYQVIDYPVCSGSWCSDKPFSGLSFHCKKLHLRLIYFS